MITAIAIFFVSIIGILVFTLILFSVLRRRQLKRQNQHHFSSYSIIHTSSDSSDSSWSYDNSSSDSSDSSWSSCSSSDSGGSSCGGGCGGGGD